MRRRDSSVRNTVSVDLLINLLGYFILSFVIAFLMINPVGRKEDDSTKPIGELNIILTWPNESAADVDLWVKSPNDVPVGYRRHEGKTLNLIRDDRGRVNDNTGLNFENVVSRGLEVGEYIVNVHLYTLYEDTPPIPVMVVVELRSPQGDLKQRIVKRAELAFKGEEITMLRFVLTEERWIDTSSIDDLYYPLFYGNFSGAGQ